MSDDLYDPDRFDDPAVRPDPSLLVERDPRNSRTTRGWYLDPTSNGTRERYWTGEGYGWSGKTRGSGPLRRRFRGLTDKQQQWLYLGFVVGSFLVYVYLTGDTEFEECRFGGGRFDYTC